MGYAIVTGVSGGLGFATAKFLLESGIHLYGISRTDKLALHHIAAEHGVDYIHYPCDLSEPSEVEQTLKDLFANHKQFKEDDPLFVINNAGIIQPIKQATAITNEELTYHYQVNVLSPMYILNTLLQWCGQQDITVIGVNVTSGAADSPLYGWSAYCSAKASVDMYTKTVALEQAELQTENKIIGFNPGVMDTNMQAEIRDADKQHFIQLEQFQQYKREGLLSQSEVVAGVLVDIVMDLANIENGKIYNVSDYT